MADWKNPGCRGCLYFVPHDQTCDYIGKTGMMTNAEYILTHLQPTEMLAQLAEEASEMAQAALKLRRAITDDNPTPRPVKDCFNNLQEEYDDVSCCMELFILYSLPDREKECGSVDDEFPKLERWRKRLEEKEC